MYTHLPDLTTPPPTSTTTTTTTTTGTITVNEMFSAIQANGPMYHTDYVGFTLDELENVFSQIDNDGNNEIDFEEFAQLFS